MPVELSRAWVRGSRQCAGSGKERLCEPARTHQLLSAPALVGDAGDRAPMRFLEFLCSHIRNSHTRRAYYRATEEFLAWCASAGVSSIADVQPVHVATWIEASTHELQTINEHCQHWLV